MGARIKPPITARVQARSMVRDHLLEVARVCQQKADEVESVNRAEGFAHIAPEVLRERAIAYEEAAAVLSLELDPKESDT